MEAAIDDRAGELTGDAEAERLLYAALAALAGLAAVAAGILLAVSLERRRSIATG